MEVDADGAVQRCTGGASDERVTFWFAKASVVIADELASPGAGSQGAAIGLLATLGPCCMKADLLPTSVSARTRASW